VSKVMDLINARLAAQTRVAEVSAEISITKLGIAGIEHDAEWAVLMTSEYEYLKNEGQRKQAAVHLMNKAGKPEAQSKIIRLTLELAKLEAESSAYRCEADYLIATAAWEQA